MVFHYRYPFIVLLFLLSTSVAAQTSPNLAQAERLVRSGQFKQAYALLQPEQFSQSGNPDFDYIFGLAALESSEPAVATLAFERVLALEPNHGAARLDMGRAYFALGDMARARREFDFALALNPPPAALAIMQRYRAEMAAIETPPTTRGSGYLEGGFGTDSNVTQGPSNSTIFLPLFKLSFTLNAASQKVQDDFSQMGAGGEITHRLSGGKSLYAGADVKWRNYATVKNTEYINTDWRGGLQWESGRDTWRIGVSVGDYRLLQQPYRTIVSLGGELRRTLNSKQQMMAFGQYSQVRYETSAQYNNNVDQLVAGVGYMAQMAAARPTVLSVSGFVGSETEETRSRPRADGDKAFIGLRLGAQMTLRPDWDLFASTSVQVSEYDRSNVLYSLRRSDAQYDIGLGAVWRFAPAWSLKPQANWTHNSSNIQAYDYERYEASLFVRRDFQ